MTRQHLLSTLLAEPTLRPLIEAAKASGAEYEVCRLENEDWCNPQNAIERKQGALSRTTDAGEIKRLLSEIAQLNSPGAQVVAQKMRGLVLHKFEPHRGCIAQIIAEAERLVKKYQADAASTEADFFTSNGLPWEATTLSRQYAPHLAELSALKAAWSNAGVTNGAIISTDSTPLARWFGIVIE
jgi:hypothetical protein